MTAPLTADTGAAFTIAIELLAEQPAALTWSNLGYWAQTSDYVEACRQLALLVGTAAQLVPDTKVLDLACGHGASLALWPQAFGVQHVTAIELRGDCIDAIQAAAPPALQAIHQASFDSLPLPDALPAHTFDAVLCVDAAYLPARWQRSQRWRRRLSNRTAGWHSRPWSYQAPCKRPGGADPCYE